MFYLIKQRSIQKALKVRSIFIASTAATLEPIEGVMPTLAMLRGYIRRYNLDSKITLSEFFKVMSSNIFPPEDKAQIDKILPVCQKIYDSYKETVLPTLYNDAIQFNCVASWDVYVQIRQALPRMLNGKAVAINKPTFSLCTDPWHDKTLVLSYMLKGSRKRIAFTLNIAERRFDVQSYPAELDITEDGCVVIPGKTVLADVCRMLQMPIWAFNEYAAYFNWDNKPFYMAHDLLEKKLPNNITDLPIFKYSTVFTLDNFLCMIRKMQTWKNM
jgi:hypothetical protein